MVTSAKSLPEKKSAPLDDIDRWADALELDGNDREAFIRAALDDYAPNYVKRLLFELDSLREQVACTVIEA